MIRVRVVRTDAEIDTYVAVRARVQHEKLGYERRFEWVHLSGPLLGG